MKEKKTLVLLLLATVIITTDNTFAENPLNFEYSEGIYDTTEVLTIAEEMPEIIGGIQEVYKHIDYPRAASLNNIQGRVFVRFIVDEQGNVQQPEILKDIGGGCGDAALKGIQKVKFTPGKQNGLPVSVYYTLPITLKIQG